jgi:hypothetical protein
MICANDECKIEFESKTHNQKYCCDECCRVSTNRRIMQKYYEKKAIRNGLARLCKKCKSQLSRYNESNLCSQCTKKINSENNYRLLGMIDEVS